MQSELKPCPFCGGEAVMQEPHWRDGNLCGEAPFCRVCGIKTPRYWPKRTGTAIAAWNTRASDAEITRLTEALRAAEEREKALREALGEICRDSNPDWTERRVYPDEALDDIHKIAVEAFYGVKT